MATKKTPAAKKPAKKAAAKKPVKVAIDVATFEQAAAREINVRLQKAAEIEGKADDHRLAAALKLAEAKAKCDAASINFKKWCEANVEQKFETVRKLAVVGAAKEPAKALADLREGTRQSVAKSREKAKAAKALPAPSMDAKTVIETAMAPELRTAKRSPATPRK